MVLSKAGLEPLILLYCITGFHHRTRFTLVISEDPLPTLLLPETRSCYVDQDGATQELALHNSILLSPVKKCLWAQRTNNIELGFFFFSLFFFFLNLTFVCCCFCSSSSFFIGLLACLLACVFWDSVSRSPGWPQIHSVTTDDPELLIFLPPYLPSTEIAACATTPGYVITGIPLLALSLSPEQHLQPRGPITSWHASFTASWGWAVDELSFGFVETGLSVTLAVPGAH